AALGSLPLQPNTTTQVRIEGQNSAKGDGIQLIRVSPGYMSTIGIPLIGGRDFQDSDSATAPGVAVISRAMAQKYWPHESALGKHIHQVGIHDQSFEIVGIVGNTAGYDLRRDLQAVVYLPLDQTYLMFPWQPDVTLLARAPEDPRTLVNSIRAAVANVDSTVPLFRIRTLDEQVATTLGPERFLAKILVVFAILALVLAAGGVFGLMSYATARGAHDFGVRMALGAQRHHVLWMVLRKGLVLASLGLVLGLGGALWLTRLLMSLLFGVSRTDAFTFTAVGLTIVLVALLACYLPARRATQVDPMMALREE
ncbi:MAG TPA: ABC transporter permease, partial [Candidatus Angelobacter sp.]|nr:ABC transporter permease [Candidatus Angelobacter sp.]